LQIHFENKNANTNKTKTQRKQKQKQKQKPKQKQKQYRSIIKKDRKGFRNRSQGWTHTRLCTSFPYLFVYLFFCLFICFYLTHNFTFASMKNCKSEWQIGILEKFVFSRAIVFCFIWRGMYIGIYFLEKGIFFSTCFFRQQKCLLRKSFKRSYITFICTTKQNFTSNFTKIVFILNLPRFFLQKYTFQFSSRLHHHRHILPILLLTKTVKKYNFQNFCFLNVVEAWVSIVILSKCLFIT
jgi:hypothetical protein